MDFNYKELAKESVLERYKSEMHLEQERGIFTSRFEYGLRILKTYVTLRKQGALTPKEYRMYVSIVEKEFLF